MMPFVLWGWVMQDFKLLTRQLLETYLGSDTLSDVAIQDFLDSNASIIGTGKQEFFKNIEHGSLTLAHSQYSQMSFMYGFFFVKFLFLIVVCVVIVI